MRVYKTPLPIIERSRRQKISKDTVGLNSTINQFDLIDIFRIFHPSKMGRNSALKLPQNIHMEDGRAASETPNSKQED